MPSRRGDRPTPSRTGRLPSATFAAVAVLLAACSTPPAPQGGSTPTRSMRFGSDAAASGTSTVTSTPTAVPSGELTRYGATVAAWDATHDKVAGKEFSYLPLVDGSRPTYDAVDTTEGDRVFWYMLQFPRGTDLATARERVLEEFPDDAVVERTFKDDPDCVLLDIRSAEVASVVGHGLVQVQLGTEGTGTFRPDHVDLAILGEPFENERSVLITDPFC